MRKHMEGFIKGKPIPIDLGDGKYVVRMSWVNVNALGCEIFHVDATNPDTSFEATCSRSPLLRFGIALNEDAARLLWYEMRCQGPVPSAPIIVAEVMSLAGASDAANMNFIADFERMMAWTWYSCALEHNDLLY